MRHCMSLQPLESGQVTVNNREREVKKRKSGKAKASYKDKAAPRNNGNTKEEDPRQHMERAYWDILRYTVLRCIKYIAAVQRLKTLVFSVQAFKSLRVFQGQGYTGASSGCPQRMPSNMWNQGLTPSELMCSVHQPSFFVVCWERKCEHHL
jgi:hypothetical protein